MAGYGGVSAMQQNQMRQQQEQQRRAAAQQAQPSARPRQDEDPENKWSDEEIQTSCDPKNWEYSFGGLRTTKGSKDSCRYKAQHAPIRTAKVLKTMCGTKTDEKREKDCAKLAGVVPDVMKTVRPDLVQGATKSGAAPSRGRSLARGKRSRSASRSRSRSAERSAKGQTWNQFRSANAGKGLTMTQLSKLYRKNA